ncbi:glutamate racemase [Spirosomataceae bacterium TFI 002]|nr:glutamate racemase [Spirosomataceae bacterium TFI 002]
MIGVFDSGIGGLSLLRAIKDRLPKEDYIYYADVKHVPYSYRSSEEIRDLVENACLFLREKGCDVIVLACNTATNVAVEYLREKYDFPIVAIQPAVKIAADLGDNKDRILTCATPVTLSSDRYNKLVKSLNISERLDNLPLPKLVEFAEKGIFEGVEVEAYLKKEIGALNTPEHHFIVLGCTHFTFYEDLIERLFPNLVAIDGNEGTAKRVEFVMAENGLLNSNGTSAITFYESGERVVDDTKYFDLLS